MTTMLYLQKFLSEPISKWDDANMKAKRSTVKFRMTESKAFFIIFKLPALLITPVLGFIIEFFYELPFMLVCLLDSRFRKQRPGSNKPGTDSTL